MNLILTVGLILKKILLACPKPDVFLECPEMAIWFVIHTVLLDYASCTFGNILTVCVSLVLSFCILIH